MQILHNNNALNKKTVTSLNSKANRNVFPSTVNKTFDTHRLTEGNGETVK